MHLLGAQVLKPVHPATKMCTPGAGCTLNFEHCIGPILKTQGMLAVFNHSHQDRGKIP